MTWFLKHVARWFRSVPRAAPSSGGGWRPGQPALSLPATDGDPFGTFLPGLPPSPAPMRFPVTATTPRATVE
jgi:hypothetical protein